MKQIFLFAVGFGLLLTTGVFGASVLGDRVIVAINDTPYTQRQIEMYISVKESLRKSDHVRLIRSEDWPVAVDVFVEDMMIFQESLRLGSFQPADQVVDRFLGAVTQKKDSDTAFHQNLDRLGMDQKDVRSILETVLRVDSYRKSKDRQDELAGQVRSSADKGKSGWLAALEDRGVVRMFKDAKTYRAISPTGK